MKINDKYLTQKPEAMVLSKSLMVCFTICLLLLASNNTQAYDNQFIFSKLSADFIENNIENTEELSKQVIDSPCGFFSRVFSFIKQILLLIIVLASIVLLIYFTKNIYDRFRQLRFSINDLEKKVNKFAKQNARNGYDHLELQQLQRSIYSVSNDLDELKSRIDNLYKKKDVKSTTPKPEEGKDNRGEGGNDRPKKFFMPPPGESNYFLNQNKSSHLDTDKHAFEFVLSNDSEKLAHFNLIMDQTIIEKALNYPDPFLRTACEKENFYKNDPSTIKNVKPGIAEKNEDKWVIIHKSVIRYE